MKQDEADGSSAEAAAAAAGAAAAAAGAAAASPASMPFRRPLDEEGSEGWREDLLTFGTIDLNRFVKQHGFSREDVRDLKVRRGEGFELFDQHARDWMMTSQHTLYV